MNRNGDPSPGSSRAVVAVLLGFIGVCLLVGALVFVISSLLLQKPHTQAAASPTPNSTFTGHPITGTVQPSQSGPYGFTILRNVTPQTISDLKTLRVTWVRYQLDWSHIEPQQGQFDWSQLDSTVSLLNASGIHVDFPLQNAPDWALSQKCGNTRLLPGPTEMAAYASAVAQRYNGHNGHGFIDSYEIGNEEFDDHLPRNKKIVENNCAQVNFASFYGPVLRAGYTTIKSQSPQALVGMAAIWWVDTPHIRSFLGWLYANGYGYNFDYANFHYYPCAGNPNTAAPGNPSVTDGDRPSFDLEWQTMHGIMAQYGDTGKPIWVTETGWATSDVNQPQRCVVSAQQQSQFMNYILTEAEKSHVIQELFWYTIDFGNDGMSITQSGKPLPSFYMLQQFTRQMPLW